MITFKDHCANTKQHVCFFHGVKLKDFLYDRQNPECFFPVVKDKIAGGGGGDRGEKGGDREKI